jgi:uncharacterized protein YbjT (DUF2867 family)
LEILKFSLGITDVLMGMKVAVVAGATGLVGRELVRQLCASDDHAAVIVFARDPKARILHVKNAKLVVRPFPAGDDQIVGDEFYCALGTTIKKAGSRKEFAAVDHDLVIDLAARAKSGGVNRVVVVTSVDSDANSKNFYLRVKGQTEVDLQALGLKNLEIYRPSLLLGNRDELRILERFGVLIAPIFAWTLRGPLSKYRPIEARQLAKKMIEGEPVPGV